MILFGICDFGFWIFETMAQIKPEVESFAKIKVIGVGGSGCNAISRMIACKIHGVDFIAINTDAQDLHHSAAPEKVHIGKNLTKGFCIRTIFLDSR